MNDYVIITDANADLPPEILGKFDIHVIPMEFDIDGKSYKTGDMSYKDFYSLMRDQRKLPTTTQINPQQYMDFFEPFLKSGKNVIYVCVSSKFSGTYNSACSAAKLLMGEYPELEVKVIDSACASLGQGMLIYNLFLNIEKGFTIDECVNWIEKNKFKICHWFTVDDLYHLHRGGRLSKTAAIVGSAFNVKPVMDVDSGGKLRIVQKVRGRKKAIDFLASKFVEKADSVGNDVVFISHSDCLGDAEELSQKIKKARKGIKVIIGEITPIIGAHVGSGGLALFFVGDRG